MKDSIKFRKAIKQTALAVAIMIAAPVSLTLAANEMEPKKEQSTQSTELQSKVHAAAYYRPSMAPALPSVY